MLKGSGLFKSKSDQQVIREDIVNTSNTLPNINETASSAPTPSIEPDVQQSSAPALDLSKLDLSKEDLAKLQGLRSKMVSASFGEIVTLLMRSPHYKHYSLSDLEWLVIPALLTNQFLVVEAQMKLPVPENKNSDAPVASGQSEGATKEPVAGGQPEGASQIGPRIPVGLALWAKVSPEVDEKLSSNLNTPIKLRPDEWRSGEINWIIDVLGDEKIMQSLYAKLKGDVFKGQRFKVRAQNKEGERVVTEVSGGVEEANSPVDNKATN